MVKCTLLRYFIVMSAVALMLFSRSYGDQPQIDRLETPAGNIDLIRVGKGIAIVGRDISSLERLASALGGEGDNLDEGPEVSIEIKRDFFLSKEKITSATFCHFLNEQPVELAKLYVTDGRLSYSGRGRERIEGTPWH